MSQKTLLIIDDDQELRENLAEILESEGYKTLTAYNGVDGLSLLGEHPIDLILLDLKIPGIPGMEVLKNVKQNNPAVKVIVITGRPMNWHLEDSGEFSEKDEKELAQSDAIINKPFKIPFLLDTIKTILEK
ncbi:MAG: response regulator [Spirochaetia bacterium]|jgi:CheY-like chemotaxis protein